MKKAIFIAVLGVAASVASSYGQSGFVIFSSYAANGGAGALTTLNNAPIGIPYMADLYYALGTVSDPVNEGSNGSITALPSAQFTDLGVLTGYDNSGGAVGSAGLGYFDGSTVTIPGYTSGPITFEIVAFNGATYLGSADRGRSGSFTESSIAASSSAPSTTIGDNAGGLPSFVVAPVPEPTTLALAGLGGLASLVAFRRKQA